MVQAYRPLDLIERLQSFRSRKFSGLIRFESEQGASSASKKQYFASFLLGEVNYVGTVAPDMAAIATLLTENLAHPFFKMGFKIAREQCHGSESPREVLAKVVSTRIATWEKIEGVMQSQAELALKRIAQTSGWITSEPNAGTDLCFGDDGHGLDWSLLKRAIESPAAPVSLAQPAPSQPPVATAVATGASTASAAAPVVPRAKTGRPTILSVDDSPIVQKMLQRTLSPFCKVLLANNALLALKTLNREQDIALVLLDVNMPGVSGLEFCRTIRGIAKFKTLPVVMLTANEGNVNKARGQIAGSTLYLTKPVDEQKLISVVQQYTQSHGKDSTLNSSTARPARS